MEDNNKTLTIGDFAKLLSSLTDSVKQLSFPIDFKDASPEDMVYINEYNKMLAEGHYSEAIKYRKEHSELESFIWDANKMNILQTLVLTVQSAEGTKYDNSSSNLKANNVQDAIDELDGSLDKLIGLDVKVNDCFQSVSDGKKLIASAITDKKQPTDANATFSTMAANIRKISTGSGNAYPSQVIKGKTFTNNSGTHEGTMVNHSSKNIDVTVASLDSSNKKVGFNIASEGFYSSTSKVWVAFSDLAKLIGLTADKIITGNSILGMSGTASPAPKSQSLDKTMIDKIKTGQTWSQTYVFNQAFAKTPTVTVSITTNYPGLEAVEKVTVSKVTTTGFHVEFKTAGYKESIIPTFYISWLAAA